MSTALAVNPIARIDRFVFTADDPRPAAFVLDRLYVAHALRERLAWPWHRARGGQALARPVSAESLGAAANAAVAAASRPIAGLGAARAWVLDTDYRASSRNRTVLFLFDETSPHPVLVIKRAPAGAVAGASPLSRERAALTALKGLPPDLSRTVPRVVDHEVRDGWESLAVTWLPGRSAYVDMHKALNPGSAIGDHFDLAAGWLARFHSATAVPGSRVSVPPALSCGDGPVPDWLRRLQEAVSASPVRAVRAQGDFWARNVLLERVDGGARIAGVVDWEDSHEPATPYDDLFHFALTYGLNYPWLRYRRAGAAEAFRRTFIDENRVSRAVRRYFRRYCDDRGLEVRLLEPWFRCFLRDGGRRPGSKDFPWMQCEETLGAAGRSVFSG